VVEQVRAAGARAEAAWTGTARQATALVRDGDRRLEDRTARLVATAQGAVDRAVATLDHDAGRVSRMAAVGLTTADHRLLEAGRRLHRGAGLVVDGAAGRVDRSLTLLAPDRLDRSLAREARASTPLVGACPGPRGRPPAPSPPPSTCSAPGRRPSTRCGRWRGAGPSPAPPTGPSCAAPARCPRHHPAHHPRRRHRRQHGDRTRRHLARRPPAGHRHLGPGRGPGAGQRPTADGRPAPGRTSGGSGTTRAASTPPATGTPPPTGATAPAPAAAPGGAPTEPEPRP
jgi:hypothetical protein